MNRVRVSIVLSVLMSTAFAGCAADPGTQGETGGASATASAATTGSSGPVGSIRGNVVDEELRGIAGASVGIIETALQVEADASGAFAFEGLAPGTYEVVAQKIGYQSRATRVTVNPSEATWVNLTLAALAIQDGYYETWTRTLVFDCLLFANPVWVSACSYPYTAVYLEAKRNGVNLSQYGLPEDVQDSKVRVNFTVGYNMLGGVTELFWTPNTDIAKRMLVNNCKPDSYDPVLDSCGVSYGQANSLNPLNFQWKLAKADAPKEPGHVAWVMAAIWPWPGALTDPPGVILEQKVELYQTLFYGIEPPEDFSVNPAPP